MTPEEIIKEVFGVEYIYEGTKKKLIDAFDNFGNQRFIEGRDKALNLAVKKAEIKWEHGSQVDRPNGINEDSILSLKDNENLQP